MIPISHKANVWICVYLLISVQCGCSAKISSPSKDDLAKLLGKLDENVVVLGGKIVASEDRLAKEPSQLTGSQASTGRLWIVASRDALPCPYPRDQASLETMRTNTLDPKIRVELNAFPARVAYDISGELGIAPKSLELPLEGTPQTSKGRISEWSNEDHQIRIRDFRTTVGWLSIVESFESADF
ncbi:MAG: hypothetical protein NTW52_10085 [Planctomycetota bacterium]|nr:hypothetical protein [Planctomycetota bacterium]